MKLAPLCTRVNETIDVFEVPSCRTHSEFEEQISLFKGHVEQARDNLLEIEDCIAELRKDISSELKAIESYNYEIAGLSTQQIKAKLTQEPDQAQIEELDGKIADLKRSVDEAAEHIANCLGSIVGCEKLRQPWRDARGERKRIHDFLKKEDGRGRKGGVPRSCGALTTKGTHCMNPKQYVDGDWVECQDHR